MRVAYTKDMIENIVCEVVRRIELDIQDMVYETYDDVREGTKEKMQGVYSAVMATASNWSECVWWFDELEVKYGIL